MIDLYNKKLEEINNLKKQALEEYNLFSKKMEQSREMFISLIGAEKILLQLIEECKIKEGDKNEGS